MKRRNFLSLLGAAAVAPVLPSMGGASAASTAVGYNRYMYGLGVFHARTQTGLTTADLMARLKLSTVQAEAMMGEMTASGVFSPISAVARMSTAGTSPRKPYIRKALRHLQEMLQEEGDRPVDLKPLNEADEIPSTTRVCSDGVQPMTRNREIRNQHPVAPFRSSLK